MKKYLPGIIAIIMAFSAFAFTDVSFAKSRTGASIGDPCAENFKHWYIINYDCLNQSSIAILRDPSNYIVASQAEVNSACVGTECVCAIWACPGANPMQPLITTSTLIYGELWDFFRYGNVSADLALKDQVYGTERRQQ